jgi:hypothetical protein
VKITISFELNMTDKDMHDWANEYGLSMEEVASDATGHLGELVRAHLAQLPHVKEFTTVQNYHVK